METVASWVTIGENERLLSLSLSPLVGKFGSVPVNLIEQVRNVNPALRAVTLGWESHIVLVVMETGGRVVARWEVDIRSKRRGISVTVPVWESDTRTSISWILDPDAVESIRVSGV